MATKAHNRVSSYLPCTRLLGITDTKKNEANTDFRKQGVKQTVNPGQYELNHQISIKGPVPNSLRNR